jgi:hypothetical protein
MSRYTQDVTLPDGRQFHVVARFGPPERDTNSGGDYISVDITDMDDNELDGDAYSEEITVLDPLGRQVKTYLWELCADLAATHSPDDDDDWYDD